MKRKYAVVRELAEIKIHCFGRQQMRGHRVGAECIHDQQSVFTGRRIATEPNYFTFISDCTKGSYRMILGDARLRLREAPAGKYGLLIMDAFSSDSVPAHLLTTEAMDLYLSKLSNDGILAFHISNRYLNLEPLLSGLSRRAGLVAFIRRDEERNVVGRYPSLWIIMARNDSA